MGELFTVYGEASGAASGDLSLRSDLYRGTTTVIRIPKLHKAKIWSKRIAGAAVTMIINASRDITVASPSYEVRDKEVLSSTGELYVSLQKPIIIIEGRTGKEGFKVSWAGLATDAVSNISLEVELGR